MRVLIVMPHFFGAPLADAVNRSRVASARAERLRALASALCSLHQTLGAGVYGLDHGQATAWRSSAARAVQLDVVVCTTGDAHLLNELTGLAHLFRHVPTDAEPMTLGFFCHRVLSGAKGRYDYYGFVEDDVVLTDPMFFRKRRWFDRHFGPDALLQPNRYELAVSGPVRKLYVDYRINANVTARYQNLDDVPRLELPFLDGNLLFERTTYPSAGCFFLNDTQLDRWVASPFFLDGDTSYLSALDSAVTLSVMKTFRIYKPALRNAGFLEVLHASPRWVASVTQVTTLRDLADEH